MASASAIQRTMHLLLPTASSLPSPLSDLASSLLAQSRVKATSLKPEEEIARTFACCHIACERLKNKHALEIGKVGPPCGPRIYKRLYGFLDSALAAVPSTPKTKRVQEPDVKNSPVSTPSVRQTGASQGALSGPKATPSSLGKRGRGITQPKEHVALPRSIMPMIRHICSRFETPEAANHVYAGVESVYGSMQPIQVDYAAVESTPSKRRKGDGARNIDQMAGLLGTPTEKQIPALVAVVYLQTTSVMYDEADSTDAERRREVLDAVQGYLAEQVPTNSASAPSVEEADIMAYIRACQSSWLGMEWYLNLAQYGQGAGASSNRDLEQNGGSSTPMQEPAKTPLWRKEKHARRPVNDDEDEDLGAAGLLSGLGTMFQPAVDWLSEDRRADLTVWKKDIMNSIAHMEQRA